MTPFHEVGDSLRWDFSPSVVVRLVRPFWTLVHIKIQKARDSASAFRIVEVHSASSNIVVKLIKNHCAEIRRVSFAIRLPFGDVSFDRSYQAVLQQ